MKITLLILIIMVGILYIRPYSLIYLSSTALGKLLLLITLVIAACHSTVCGLLMAILFICLLNFGIFYEPFTKNTSDKTNNNGTNLDSYDDYKTQIKLKIPFQKQHCQKSSDADSDDETLNFVDSGKVLKNSEIKGKIFQSLDNKMSLSVNFTDDECNPCDTICNYTLTESDERISGEEKLRGKDSSTSLPSVSTQSDEVSPNLTRSSSGYVANNKAK